MARHITGVLLLVLLHVVRGYAQDLDSLRAIWDSASRSDSVRFHAYNDLIWEGFLFSDPDSAHAMALYMEQQAADRQLQRFVAVAVDAQAASWYARGDFAKARSTFERSRAIYEAIGDQAGLADVITNIAIMHSFMGEKDQALALYEEGLAMHLEQQDSVSIANDLNSIGTIHMMRGDHLRAVDHFAHSLAIQRRLGNERGTATTLINIGEVYMAQGDCIKALEQYAQAERLAAKLKDDHQLAKALLETGTCHQELGDVAKAMEHYTRSLELRTALDDQHGISTALNKIADVHRIRGEHELAVSTFERSAAIAREQESPFNEGTAWTGMGNTLLGTGRTAEALAAARKALPLAQEAEEVSLHRDAADLAYRALKQLGRHGEAIVMLELSRTLDDSLMREENQRAILRNEYAYAYEEQALADSLRHQTERFELITAHRDRRNLMSGGLVLLAVIGLALLARMRYMKRANAQVLAAQEQVVAMERQREAELVRTRIARDIHDDMGGAITKIGMLSTEARRLMDTDPLSAGGTLARISSVSRDLAISLQDVVSAVDPRSDDVATIVAQARTMATRLLEGSHLQTDLSFDHQGGARMVDPERKRTLMLLLKEAITNVLKHAEATRISVTFTTGDEHFELRVSDNGKGFQPEEFAGGNGMRNMHERASSLGAEMELNGARGQGCMVHVRGPLHTTPLLPK